MFPILMLETVTDDRRLLTEYSVPMIILWCLLHSNFMKNRVLMTGFQYDLMILRKWLILGDILFIEIDV